MSIIKRTVRKLQHAMKKPAFLERQTFVVRYQVMVKNTLAKQNELAIVVPVPSNRQNQKIASAPRFTPAATLMDSDLRFGNQFALWKIKLAASESRLFTQHLTVSVGPMQKNIPEDLLLSEYKEKAEAFCVPSAHIQSDDAQMVAFAKEALKQTKDAKTALMAINELVIKRLEYGNPIKGLYGAVEAVKNVKVDCGGYDSLFVALCVAAGIPARIVSGFWAGYPKNEMHAWVEAQLPNGEWVPADPSMEALSRAGRTHKLGKLGAIGSDRIAFSVGCDIPFMLGKKKVVADILQHPYIEATGGDRSFIVETRVETTKA